MIGCISNATYATSPFAPNAAAKMTMARRCAYCATKIALYETVHSTQSRTNQEVAMRPLGMMEDTMTNNPIWKTVLVACLSMLAGLLSILVVVGVVQVARYAPWHVAMPRVAEVSAMRLLLAGVLFGPALGYALLRRRGFWNTVLVACSGCVATSIPLLAAALLAFALRALWNG